MLEAVAKNLWLLLTLVIPGLATFGAWRAILLLEPSRRLTVASLAQIDGSALVTTSIIVAIAVLQQAVAIVVEALLALLATMMHKRCPNFHALFCDRFALAAAGKLDDNTTRIIGNFFLSTNMCIGLGLLLCYFLAYEAMDFNQWIPQGLAILLLVTFVTAGFRMVNAKEALAECEREHRKKRRQTAPLNPTPDSQR